MIRVLTREDEVKKAARAKFVQGLKDCEGIILPAAQALALPHKRSGRYLRSLGYTVDETKVQAALYAGGKAAFHAHLVEFGTHKTAPQAIQRRAAEQTRTAMGEAIAKRMKEPL